MAVASPVIASVANPLIKDIRRAVSRGGRTSGGALVAESFHLLAEALRSPVEIDVVVAAERVAEKTQRLLSSRPIPLRVVTDKLFDSLAPTESTQGVLTLLHLSEWSWEDLLSDVPLLVVLDGVQDPGNAGAVARSAEAFAATGLVFLPETARCDNPKTLRAAAGSLFRTPFIEDLSRKKLRERLAGSDLKVFAASARQGMPLDRCPWASPLALLIGSEAHGVSAPLREISREIRIPTQGVESLNAAAAAAILLYEARRQRSREDVRL
jgi:TrmH family RNA methyltransferase